MKALYVNGPGDDNLTYGDLPEPTLQEATDVIVGCVKEPKNDFEEVVKLLEAGSIRGVVDSVLPLNRAEEAYDRMKGSNFFGKIALAVP